MDRPRTASEPGKYVTGKVWTPELDGTRAGRAVQAEPPAQRLWARAVQPRSVDTAMPELEAESDDEEMDSPAPRATRPTKVTVVCEGVRDPVVPATVHPVWLTDEQCMARLRESGRDWSAPLHPGKHARHREALEHALSQDEQAQAHYIGILLAQLELEETTKKSYADGLKKFMVMLNRGYPLSALSPDHERLAVTGLFEPAVWKPHEVEKVLIDTVLHEVGVRGNAWSTVRVQMYGIRHHNVAKGLPNPLANKLRYDQLMRALKKFRGPKAGKAPATRAMLFALCKELDWETDMDDLIQYAAILTAFHFMLRSAEYSARLKEGKFDVDRVIRLMDIKFFIKGVEIHTGLELADEVEVTLGKQKASEGGEKRRHTASLTNRDLCVVRILALLVTKKGRAGRHLPLFTWGKGSKRAGEGVRYHDSRRLAQRAAELCGRDTQAYL